MLKSLRRKLELISVNVSLLNSNLIFWHLKGDFCLDERKILRHSGRVFSYEIVENTLPELTEVFKGNTYAYEYLLQAWALLSKIYELPQERYEMELGNLADLADSLSEYFDDDIMDKCYTILDCISHFRNMSREECMDKIHDILMKSDSHTFIEIYYRGGILSKKLKMYLNMDEYGAFGISQGSDIIQILDCLLGESQNINSLDLGSGNGFSTCIISNRMKRVTGVEINSELYEESISCLRDLADCNKVDENKISLIQSDFFDIDFNPFSFIYIYWPFNDREKSFWEKEVARRLENKIIKESAPGTIIAVLIPGTEEKDIFPGLESIPLNIDSVQSVVKAYRV